MILDWNKQDIGLYATCLPRKIDCSLGLFTLPGFLENNHANIYGKQK